MTEKPMSGTWMLVAPDGRAWVAESPMECCRAEQNSRIPPAVALSRVLAALEEEHEVVLSKHIAERAALALEQGIDLPRVARWVAADIRRAMTPNTALTGRAQGASE